MAQTTDTGGIDALASWLSMNTNAAVTIEGHADRLGPEDFNLALSRSRAAWVKERLVRRGIDGGRIRVAAYGSQRPVLGAEVGARSRRVELHVSMEN